MKALGKGDQEILVLLSEGMPDHGVCQELNISPRALKSAIRRIELRAAEDTEDAGRYYEQALRRRADNRAVSLQARFDALMTALPEAVLVIDGRSGQIREVNEFACKLFGYGRKEMLRLTVEDLVPEDMRTRHVAYRLGFLANARKRRMGYHPAIFGLRADGSQIQMAIALTATHADDDVMVVCTEHSVWKSLRR